MRVRLFLLICLLAAIAPSGASAATLHVSPAGSSAGSCEEHSPCTPDHAINGVAQPGDDVTIAPGEYQLARPLVAMGISVRGAPGQQRPRLYETGAGSTTVSLGSGASAMYSGITLVLDQGASASDLALYQSSANGTALNMQKTGAQGIVAVATGGAGTAVLLQGGSDLFPGSARLRDSVAHASGSLGQAMSVGGLGVEMRNVTALAPGGGGEALDLRGSAFCAQSFCPGALPARVTARNVILDGGLVDATVSATGGYGTFAELKIGNSSFRPGAVLTSGTGSVESLGANQSADPLLVDPANGDFRQSSQSPTIDAGVSDEHTGTQDLDGGQRTIGAAPDIGADEYVPPSGGTGGSTPASGQGGAAPATPAATQSPAVPARDGVAPSVTLPRALTVRRNGVIRFRLGPVSEAAIGVARLASAGKVGGRIVALGAKLLEVSRLQRPNVTIKLSERNLRLLKKRRRLRVTLRVKLTDAAGNSSTRAVTTTLKAP